MIKRLTLAALSALTLLAATPMAASAQDATAPTLQTRDSYLIVTRQIEAKEAMPFIGMAWGFYFGAQGRK